MSKIHGEDGLGHVTVGKITLLHNVSGQHNGSGQRHGVWSRLHGQLDRAMDEEEENRAYFRCSTGGVEFTAGSTTGKIMTLESHFLLTIHSYNSVHLMKDNSIHHTDHDKLTAAL